MDGEGVGFFERRGKRGPEMKGRMMYNYKNYEKKIF